MYVLGKLRPVSSLACDQLLLGMNHYARPRTETPTSKLRSLGSREHLRLARTDPDYSGTIA